MDYNLRKLISNIKNFNRVLSDREIELIYTIPFYVKWLKFKEWVKNILKQ